MSYQDGRSMDRPWASAGSVERARQRTGARAAGENFSSFPIDDMLEGLDEPEVAPVAPVGFTAGPSGTPRPQPPARLQTSDDGQEGPSLSGSTQIPPQWPLQGPLVPTANSSSSQPYRPPPGRSQPPPRPPRPSQVPSILDGSRTQGPTPLPQYRSQNVGWDSTDAGHSVPETSSSFISRPSTQSSAESIPDYFTLPIQMPTGPPRRSASLGPPPSSRRGGSSFYSINSQVSPIPEESPYLRSHVSYASSGAMPGNWGVREPGPSPEDYQEGFYEDTIAEESATSVYEEDDVEESKLVRSASLGKRAQPTLVNTSAKPSDGAEVGRPSTSHGAEQSPDVNSAQNQFAEGTSFMDTSSYSSQGPPARVSATTAFGSMLTTNSMLNAYNAASATDPANSMPPLPQRGYSQLSAAWRPPRLDMDAVRRAESRGSLTSLPDLIRRATRLAASLERGRRPASRFGELDDFPGTSSYENRDPEKEMTFDPEKERQSGLSDMLAAFPPPAQQSVRQSFRGGLRQSIMSWPLPLNGNNGGAQDGAPDSTVPGSDQAASEPTKRRRCCGLPLWAFILLVLILLILIAAAVVIPLEILVVHKRNSTTETQTALAQCQSQITCANGGTNVVTQGFCACICTNGFTGFDCTTADTAGCTSMSVTGGVNLNNVTLGDAIPRLIDQAQTNFSISLSAPLILAKLNSGNLSCSAQNALVTFDGQDTAQGDVSAPVSAGTASVAPSGANGVLVMTVTVMALPSTTWTMGPSAAKRSAPTTSLPESTPPHGIGKRIRADTSLATNPSYDATVFTTTTTTITITTFVPTLTSTSAITSSSPPSTQSTAPTTSSSSLGTPTSTMSAPSASATFMVTEEVLDFARVAVLFVLQQESLVNAETAQTTLQQFLTSANTITSASASGVTVTQAHNVTLGNGNSVDLVTFRVDVGAAATANTTMISTTARKMARGLLGNFLQPRHPFVISSPSQQPHGLSTKQMAT